MVWRSVVVGCALAVLVPAPALATQPGTNGQLAFRRYLDAKNTTGAVFVIAPDGSGERQVTRPPRGTIDDQPDWSPDGKQLVFGRCREGALCRIMIVNADGSGLRALTPLCKRKPARHRVPRGCEDAANASFTPDGKHVSYTRATGRVRDFPKYETDQIERSELVVIRTDGRGARVILRSRPFDSDEEWPMLSPDGKTFLVERATSPVGHPRLTHGTYVVGADGRGLRRVTPLKLRGGDGPDWAPDGSRILFRSNEDTGDFLKSHLFTVRPDGGGLTQLTHFASGTRLFSASFSPDGTRIVFGMAPKGTALPDVYTMAADGSDIQRVTTSSKWDSAPDWGTAAG
jgi:TolB protein